MSELRRRLAAKQLSHTMAASVRASRDGSQGLRRKKVKQHEWSELWAKRARSAKLLRLEKKGKHHGWSELWARRARSAKLLRLEKKVAKIKAWYHRHPNHNDFVGELRASCSQTMQANTDRVPQLPSREDILVAAKSKMTGEQYLQRLNAKAHRRRKKTPGSRLFQVTQQEEAQ